MNPIFITVTEYHAEKPNPRTINANTIVKMQPVSLKTGQRGSLLECSGGNSITVLESLEQIRALVQLITPYS